jgi:sodium transport system permease protein
MRSPVFIVWTKELLDSTRERRTLFSLLIGPLIGPLLFVMLMNVMVSQSVSSAEDRLDVAMLGAERAPNLIAYLRAREIYPLAASEIRDLDDAADAVAAGRRDLVLAIDDRYGEDFGTARPARVTLIYDRSKQRAMGRVERVRGVINAYGQQIGALRLVAHGVDPTLQRPLIVDDRDVSTSAGRAVLLLSTSTYFLLFALLSGGMHLAIDTTAGERERKSLEPLLALPVPRASLLLGKMAATVVYMLAALAVSLAGYVFVMRHLPLEKLAMTSSFGFGSAVEAFFVLLPVAPLGAALMTLIASFTRTYREAQTYISFMLLVPTFPVLFAAITNVEASPKLMWIPSLSQHLLVTALIKAQPLDPLQVALSAVGTLAFAALLGWIAVRLYRREAILG